MLETELIPAEEAASRRLMVVLHGLGDSIAGYEWLPEAMELPWLNYLLVNAPDAYFGGFSWYDYAGDAIAGIHRSRKLLFELLDDQAAKGFRTEDTVLFGFSQGCLMTVDVGLRYPRVLAGLVGISGYVSEPEQSLKELSPVARKQRFLITHGHQDPIIPFAMARSHFQLLKEGQLNISWHEFAKAHTIAGESELRLIRDFVKAGYTAA